MEYLIGSVTTIATMIVVLFVIRKVNDSRKQSVKIFYSQSNIYERIKPAIPFMPPKPRESQAFTHRKAQMVRVVMTGGKAYWINDNKLFEAPISEEGLIDYSSSSPIDTMTMDKVELDKISFIVEKLTEGDNDDRSNPRNKNV